MNRNRRLSMVGATLAGLIGVTALTGAASASAESLTPTVAPGGSASAPATPADQVKPSTDVAKPADAKVDRQAPAARSSYRSDRTTAKVKAAVLAAYPKATITSITARDGGGWTISLVTHGGHKGTVAVDRHYSVSKPVLAQARHHRQG
jgi:hypothetical protein